MTAFAYAEPRARGPRRGGRSGRQAAGSAGLNGFQVDVVFWLTAALLAAALMLGGASRENAPQLMVLELLSLPLIAAALWRLLGQDVLRAGLAAPLALLAGAMLLPLLQLAPIPFDIWRTLPGREALAQGLILAGVPPQGMPLSLTPAATEAAMLTLLVPAAVFLGACAVTSQQRRMLAGLIVLAVGLSLILGVLQVAGGEDSILRFYATTNADAAVGLFANRNHQAIFLLLSLPLLAVSIRQAVEVQRSRGLLLTAIALSLFGLALIGVAITRSRAGFGLAVPAVLGSLLLVRGRKGAADPRRGLLLAGLGLVTILALSAVALFALDAVLQRFAPGVSEDYRIEAWPYVVQAAERFSPLGSGLGSFEQVYRSVEPVELMLPTFVNHAHNEYLELWLESGLAGVALAAAFVAWLVWRCIQAWSGRGDGSGFAPACGMIAMLLMLHSVVDYPLRTPAIACVMALACAVLARQAIRETHPRGGRSGREKALT